MAVIDIILLVILIGFFISGFSFGLIKSLGSLIGTVVGIYLATQWYEVVAQYLEPIFMGNANLARVVCFLLVMLVVDVIITIIFYIIDRVIGWLPLIKGLNKFGGAIFGVIKGVLFLAILIYILSLFPWWQTLNDQIEKSFIGQPAINLVEGVLPFMTNKFKDIKDIL